jgi:two-component system response regulator NreC
MASSITIMICDDHALFRSGLRRVLEAEDDLEVIAEAGRSNEALELVRVTRPDVLLLDVTMPGRSGIEALPELIASAPDTKVLVLSMQDDPAYVRQALTTGANGYLLKDAADAELVKAIREVRLGHRYVHPALGARLAAGDVPVATSADRHPLSDREHEVLRLLALGHTNQEIARLLFISVRTAESHRAKIVQKLGLKSRAELVRFALESGYLDTLGATSSLRERPSALGSREERLTAMVHRPL